MNGYDEDNVRAKNTEICKKLMSSFNMETWHDLLHDELVLEFPYASYIGMPDRVVGKKKCVSYLSNVMKNFSGLEFEDVIINGTEDPNKLIVEYNGNCKTPTGVSYKQIYATVQKFKDGKMILFREFWNPMAITEAFGDNLSSEFA